MKCDKCGKDIYGSHIHQPDGRDLCFPCDRGEVPSSKQESKK